MKYFCQQEISLGYFCLAITPKVISLPVNLLLEKRVLLRNSKNVYSVSLK